ncbi:MAG TPA: TetR/AcrR family transcriptional regulator [Kofleriaceae bacterium]|nr:TetR/AcrR family transcriptional regulator [Kofleriaceae bacterium]
MTKRKIAPPSLSHDAICAAALDVIDRDGLDAFSTRKLGRALGVEAMAIYHYYPSKDALLDAVSDHLTAHLVELIVDDGDFIATLRRIAHAFRAVARAHPEAFPLLATRRFASAGTYTFMERLFELARTRGIPDPIAARFYRVVSSYVSGFALNELATPPRRIPKRFARVAAVSKWLSPRHLDETFHFGLELQLAALAKVA